ncbi:hypothetical protein BDY19DRAFT_1044947 [Irpex rosettiformis]|uniref:Uncharacterized protein n=1 Tax=Irpex rosettiformis TaxID=378272 RepID=A0ACB8UGX8_9APHY|nr:hypothetical protein BDY19DRAFT_1044947 [Irpex rosettiformis]
MCTKIGDLSAWNRLYLLEEAVLQICTREETFIMVYMLRHMTRTSKMIGRSASNYFCIQIIRDRALPRQWLDGPGPFSNDSPALHSNRPKTLRELRVYLRHYYSETTILQCSHSDRTVAVTRNMIVEKNEERLKRKTPEGAVRSWYEDPKVNVGENAPGKVWAKEVQVMSFSVRRVIGTTSFKRSRQHVMMVVDEMVPTPSMAHCARSRKLAQENEQQSSAKMGRACSDGGKPTKGYFKLYGLIGAFSRVSRIMMRSSIGLPTLLYASLGSGQSCSEIVGTPN